MIEPLRLQELLATGSHSDAASGGAATRLESAINSIPHGLAGAADLAGLVRDALRGWQEINQRLNLPWPIKVPATAPWPSPEEWSRSGITVTPGPEPDLRLIVSVRPWQPAWMEADQVPLDSAPASRKLRRPDDPWPVDPVWKAAFGLDQYRSLEQREAVRTLLTCEQDATVLVCLPTGGGKSLVGLLVALAPGGTGSTTLVVVPTVSLAIDQEEQLRKRLQALQADDAGGPFAFHSGVDLGLRREMMARIVTGEQRVVFTSPESACGALQEPLRTAARAGKLAQFVIDEAHIVAGWGSEFRPDFQLLSGLRRELMALATEGGSRFRTVLMTATATAQDVQALKDLFVDSGSRLVACGAVALRPEIDYWVNQSSTPEERHERVLTAVLNMPRPLFVYTSTRQDAWTLEQSLRQIGLLRTVIVTGDSGESERRRAVRELRGDPSDAPRADVAVGTSAFGLGIDIPDVRCVIHACLPESIDRYYQEAGRAGRDGRSATSLLLWTSTDVTVARSLNEQKLITTGLAKERWRAMRARATGEGDNFAVPLSALRIGLLDDSEENEKWNSRTLSLMARSGLVRLTGVRRLEGDAGSVATIQLLRHDLGVDSGWQEFDDARSRTLTTRRRQLAGILEIADGGSVCDALQDTYTVPADEILTATLLPDDACGGCSGCRAFRDELAVAAPSVIPPAPVARASLSRIVDRLVGRTPTLLVTSSPSDALDRLYARAISGLCRGGIRHLVCSGAVAERRAVARSLASLVLEGTQVAPLLTHLDEFEMAAPDLAALPTLLILESSHESHLAVRLLHAPDGLPVPRLAILPSTFRSWERPDMTVGEFYPAGLTLADLIQVLEGRDA